MMYNKIHNILDSVDMKSRDSEKACFPPKREDGGDEFVMENKIINLTDSAMIIQGINNKAYKCYLFDMIGHIKDYEGVFSLFKILKKDAIVDLYISSYGGYVNTGLLICSAMMECEATINTHVLDVAMSMGGLIWAFGDNLNLFPGAIVMFHNISAFFYGQLGSIRKKADHMNSIGNNFFDYCIEKKILLKEEAEAMMAEDKEFYIPYIEMMKRLEKGKTT